MKKIKSFESFSMHRDNCDRCGESTNGTTILSMYNDEVICMKCKEEEKNRPDYKDACDVDNDQIRKGNYNFKGIGYTK